MQTALGTRASTDGAGPLDVAAALSEAIDAIGTSRFDRVFTAAVNRLLRVDHCTINSYSLADGMSSITVAGRIDAAAGRSLTRDYVGWHYRSDPNFPDLQRYRKTRRVIVRPLDLRRIGSREYRHRFFAQSGLIDKIALIWYADFKAYNMNLYRARTSGRYSAAERALVARAAGLLASIARQHCQHFLVQKDLSTGNMLAFVERLANAAEIPLTRRELDVVSRIALGYRMEAIALDLGIGFESAVSYRKRAYKKLGISSQSELFGLCLRNLHRFVRSRGETSNSV